MTRKPKTRKPDPRIPDPPAMTLTEVRIALAAERHELLRCWMLRRSTPGERERLGEIERALGAKGEA